MSRFAWPLLLFAAGMFAFPLRQLGPGWDHLPGDLVDGRFNLVILEHGFDWLRGRAAGFWSPPFFDPVPGVKAFSDAHVGTLPLYAAGRLAGLTPERAYQLWYVVPFALNFGAALWAARRWGLDGFGAACCAYLFAFGLPLATLVGLHSQLNPRWVVPVAYLAAREKRWAWASLAVVAQCYFSLYVGYWLAFSLAAWAAASAAADWRRGTWTRPEWREALDFVLPLLLLAPLLWPYVRAIPERPGDPRRYVESFFPELGSWFTAPHLSQWRPTLDESGLSVSPAHVHAFSEKQLFLGIVPLASLLWGLWRRESRPLALGALLAALAITRFGGVALYNPLLNLPGVGGFRAAGRVLLVLLFPLGLLCGMLLSRYTSATARAALLALLLADQALAGAEGNRAGDWRAVRAPLAEVGRREAAMRSALAARGGAARVCVLADPHRELFDRLAVQLDAVRAAQALGVPAVNGYSSGPPWGWAPFESATSADEWLRDWRALDFSERARTLYVGFPAELEREVDWRFSRRFRWSGWPAKGWPGP